MIHFFKLKERSPIIHMLLAIIFLSFLPLAFKLGAAHKFPFLLIGIYKILSGLLIITILFTFFRQLFADRQLLFFIKKHLFSPTWFCINFHFILACLSNFEYLAFAYATTFLPYAVVSVLYSLWPLIFIFYTFFLFRQQNRFSNNLLRTAPIFLLAFSGIALIIISQHKAVVINWVNLNYLFYGIFFAILASCLAALSSHGIMWGSIVSSSYLSQLKNAPTSRQQNQYLGSIFPTPEILLSIFIWGVSATVVGILLISVGIYRSSNIDEFMNHMGSSYSPQISILLLVILSFFVVSFFRMANLSTKNLTINILVYFTPLLTVTWLWIFFGVDVVNPVLFIIGATAIIMANLLINCRQQIYSFWRLSLPLLWLCCVSSYLLFIYYPV